MKKVIAGLAIASLAGIVFPATARTMPESPPPLFAVGEARPEPANARMQQIFALAFPSGARKTIDGEEYEFMPFAIVDVAPDLVALVSAGRLVSPQCPAGVVCIDASGSFPANALHYVRRKAAGDRVVGEWTNFGGKGVGQWGLTSEISESPVFYNSFNAGTGRDCVASRAVLTEFTRRGPVELAAFPVFYEYNDGRDYVGPYFGAITDAEQGKQFTVTYSMRMGSGPFARHIYTPGSKGYRFGKGEKWAAPVCRKPGS